MYSLSSRELSRTETREENMNALFIILFIAETVFVSWIVMRIGPRHDARVARLERRDS